MFFSCLIGILNQVSVQLLRRITQQFCCEAPEMLHGLRDNTIISSVAQRHVLLTALFIICTVTCTNCQINVLDQIAQ